MSSQKDHALLNLIYFKLATQLSKPELRFIYAVSTGFSPDSFTAELDFTGLSKSQKNKKYATYAKLKRKNIVKRLGDTKKYMINPGMLTPSNKNAERAAITVWKNT